MPPKRGGRRGGANKNPVAANAQNVAPAPPDRATWPGWVEVESEPAIFNLMLQELGVRGLKIKEIIDLDHIPELPRPIHALIFLFRYHAADEGAGTDCPDHVWFANQIPDFACGTVALLNIVNNIPDLQLGRELRTFKEFTQGMTPLVRGHAIGSFEFARKVHNSFARESDMLEADMMLRDKVNRLKRKRAAEKAREAREAKKKSTPLAPKSANANTEPVRSSKRLRKRNPAKSTPQPTVKKANGGPSTPASKVDDDDDEDYDGDEDSPARKKAKKSAPATAAAAAKENKDEAAPETGLRRSTRKPQLRKETLAEAVNRKETLAEAVNNEAGEEEEPSFHFIAYMPILNAVYKLDGLDDFPEEIGTFEDGEQEEGEDWMPVATDALRARMASHAAGGIHFNLMAVVHDPVLPAREELAQNAWLLQHLDEKLDSMAEGWRALKGGETPDEVVTSLSVEYGLSKADIREAEAGANAVTKTQIDTEDNPNDLLELRTLIIKNQAPLREKVRKHLQAAQKDEQEAKHRRHDYGSFVKGWLGALAENELLSALLDE